MVRCQHLAQAEHQTFISEVLSIYKAGYLHLIFSKAHWIFTCETNNSNDSSEVARPEEDIKKKKTKLCKSTSSSPEQETVSTSSSLKEKSIVKF